MSETSPWKIKAQRIAYQNPWIEVQHHEVVDPSGADGIYGVVHFKNVAVGIVTLDDQGCTHLIGQYRFALSEYSWEIPEGGSPVGESTLATAQRELQEEAGLHAERWTVLLECDLSNSVTNERGIVYLAEQLTSVETAPESTELLSIRKLPFADAVTMVEQGAIRDSLSILGLFAADRLLTRRLS